jgi:hypothetical protein
MAEETYSLFNDIKIDANQEPYDEDRFAFGQGILDNPRAKYWEWQSFKSWLDARIGQGGVGGALTEDITTTINAGGGIGLGVLLPTGMTFTEYVKAEHAPYTPPSFSAFAVYGNVAQPFEVGQQMTVQNAYYGTVNDSEGNAPSSIKIIGAGFDPDTIITASPHTADEPLTAVVSRTTAGTLAWTIQGLDKNLAVRSRAYSTNVFYRFLFGASALRVTNDTEAQTLYNAMQQSWLQAGKARTVTCTSDNENLALFTHIIVVTALGDITNVIQNGAQPVMGAFTKMGNFTITNAHGLSLSIGIWTTNSEGAFASGTSLAIS